MGIEDAFLTELVHDFRKQLRGEHTDFIEVVSCLVANKESDSVPRPVFWTQFSFKPPLAFCRQPANHVELGVGF